LAFASFKKIYCLEEKKQSIMTCPEHIHSSYGTFIASICNSKASPTSEITVLKKKKKLQHLQAAATMKSLNFEIQNYHLLHQVGMPIFHGERLLKKAQW
jgi:hypothetical protein